jgi:probable F420-dependent oxidoreductase
MKVGVQLHPQHTDIGTLRDAWERADALGVDSLWTWDHFYPLYGPADGEHFEGWTLLAAMAVTTKKVPFGMLVTCNSYRNPNLLADMARTIDHLSGGRFILGLGSGWFERDYIEYGYEFGTAGGRLRKLRDNIPVMKERLAKLNPPPIGKMPIMIGGGGEKVTLHIVAEHAQMWNGFGPPEKFAHKNRVLNEWCEKVGRDPSEIERTVSIGPKDIPQLDDFLEAGAEHIIMRGVQPFDFDPLEELLARR